MNYPFGKFYEKAFTGSMMGAGSSVFAVMAYAISHAKPPDGTVELNPKYLASVIGDSEDTINSAINYLCSEDARSRNPRENGRRLLVINGWLYRLTTWSEHRVGHDDLARREYFAEKQAEYRKRLKEKQSVTVNVKDSIATVTQAEAEAEAEKRISEEKEGTGRKGKLSPTAHKGAASPDELFFSEISRHYPDVDVQRELRKMDAWFLTPAAKNRKKTRRFIVNWLNKCDAPMKTETNGTNHSGQWGTGNERVTPADI